MGDLRAYLYGQGNRVPEDDAQQISSQLLAGLKFMHEEGFAHRDLKPAVGDAFVPGPINGEDRCADLRVSPTECVDQGSSSHRSLVGCIE